MFHRGSNRNDPSVEIPGGEHEVKSKGGDKPKGNACRRYKALLYRNRRHLFLVFLLCLICGIIHLMKKIPRTLRHKDYRSNPLIVPYHIEGDSLLRALTGIVVEPPAPNDEPPKAEWQWYCYSSEGPVSSPRVLLAQYSGPTDTLAHYSSLLQYSKPINMAYAKQWGMDYVILTGIALDDYHAIPSKYFQTRHSSFNKLELLRHALTLSSQYDWLWILDADAVMQNFTFSPSSILPPGDNLDSTFLMAHRVKFNDSVHTHNINNGVTFWNLHHPQTPEVLATWKRKSLNRIAAHAQLKERGSVRGVEGGDQVILHSILMNMTKEEIQGVYAIPGLQYHTVRHVVRDNHSQWVPGEDEGKGRQKALKDLAYHICHLNAPACDGIIREDYMEGDGGAVDQPFSTTGCPDPRAKK